MGVPSTIFAIRAASTACWLYIFPPNPPPRKICFKCTFSSGSFSCSEISCRVPNGVCDDAHMVIFPSSNTAVAVCVQWRHELCSRRGTLHQKEYRLLFSLAQVLRHCVFPCHR